MLIGLDGLPLTEPLAGVGHYTYELASALARTFSNHEFELAYPSTYDAFNLNEPGDSSPANLSVARVDVGLISRHWWSLGLPRYVSKRGVSLFHGTNYDVPLWRRCATVLTIHDLSLLNLAEAHELSRVRRGRRRIPIMSRSATAIITPTESVRREVCETLGVSREKVFAVPEAARAFFGPVRYDETVETRRRLGITDDFVLAVGTLEPRKNLTRLVRAFTEITRSKPERPLSLVIAGGEGWLSGPLFDEIAKSAIKERIIFTGYLGDADLRALYSSCSIFVYPSLYEGFGLPLLEAMRCGAPVITSRIEALKETAGSAADFVDPENEQSLAAAITELLEDEARRKNLAAQGMRRAAEFSWERTAQMTFEVYREALARFESLRS